MADPRIIFIVPGYSQRQQPGRQRALPLDSNYIKQLFNDINNYDHRSNGYGNMPNGYYDAPNIYDNMPNGYYDTPFVYQQNQIGQNSTDQFSQKNIENDHGTKNPEPPKQQNPIDQLNELFKSFLKERNEAKLLDFDKEQLSKVNKEDIQGYVEKEKQLRISKGNKSSEIDIDDGTVKTIEKTKINRGFFNKAGHVAFGVMENTVGWFNKGLGYILGSKSLDKMGNANINDAVKNMTLDLPESSYKYTYENAKGIKETAKGLTPEIAKESVEQKLAARQKSSDELNIWDLK